MAFWIPLAVGAGLGVVKGLADQEKASRDRKLEAATAKYSPWTGMTPNKVNEPSMIGNIVQGGTAGALFGQQFGDASASPQAMETDPKYQVGWLDMQKYQPKNPYNYSQVAPTFYS